MSIIDVFSQHDCYSNAYVNAWRIESCHYQCEGSYAVLFKSKNAKFHL